MFKPKQHRSESKSKYTPTCTFCGQPEYAYNPYTKKIQPRRSSIDVTQIVCSKCTQKLLSGRNTPDMIIQKLQHKATPTQLSTLKTFLGQINNPN